MALADHALTLMETIMADLKLESLSPTAVRCFLMLKSFLAFYASAPNRRVRDITLSVCPSV